MIKRTLYVHQSHLKLFINVYKDRDRQDYIKTKQLVILELRIIRSFWTYFIVKRCKHDAGSNVIF